MGGDWYLRLKTRAIIFIAFKISPDFDLRPYSIEFIIMFKDFIR